MPKVVEPPFETKSDYAICAAIAGKLGVGDAYTEGRDERGWVDLGARPVPARRGSRACRRSTSSKPRTPGVYSVPVDAPAVAFEDFRRDPEGHPLPTPSGKIEIFSKSAPRPRPAGRDPGRPEVHPGVGEPVRAGGGEVPAPGRRATTSCPASTPPTTTWTGSRRPSRSGVFINPVDAAARGIRDGDRGQGLQRPGRARPAVPGHGPDHARRRGHPAGRVVGARTGTASTAGATSTS